MSSKLWVRSMNGYERWIKVGYRDDENECVVKRL